MPYFDGKKAYLLYRLFIFLQIKEFNEKTKPCQNKNNIEPQRNKNSYTYLKNALPSSAVMDASPP